jgi:hypothetical protein
MNDILTSLRSRLINASTEETTIILDKENILPTLDNPGILSLIQNDFKAIKLDNIIVKCTEAPKFSDDEKFLLVEGVTSLFNTAGCKISAAFGIIEQTSELTMTLKCNLPEYWSFSDSFPSLKYLDLDYLILSNCYFIFTSHDQPDAQLTQGLNFSGDIIISTNLKNDEDDSVKEKNLQQRTVTGHIKNPHSNPIFKLEGDKNNPFTDLNIELINISRVKMNQAYPVVECDYNDKTDTITCMNILSGNVSVNDIPIGIFDVEIPSGKDTIKMILNREYAGVNDIGELFSLITNNNHIYLMPATLINLDFIKLSRFMIVFDPEKINPTNVFVSIQLRNQNTWAPLSFLSVSNFTFDLDIKHILDNDDEVQTIFKCFISGSICINEQLFDIRLFVPYGSNWIFTIQSNPKQPLTIENIANFIDNSTTTQFVTEITKSLPEGLKSNIYLQNIQFGFNPFVPSFGFASFTIEQSKPWIILQNILEIKDWQITSKIEQVDNAWKYNGTLDGTITLGKNPGTDVVIDLSIPPKPEGWSLSLKKGGITIPSFSYILDLIGIESSQLPEGLDVGEITIKTLNININPSDKKTPVRLVQFVVSTNCPWEPVEGLKVNSVELDFKATNEGITGRIYGEIELAKLGATFFLSGGRTALLESWKLEGGIFEDSDIDLKQIIENYLEGCLVDNPDDAQELKVSDLYLSTVPQDKKYSLSLALTGNLEYKIINEFKFRFEELTAKINYDGNSKYPFSGEVGGKVEIGGVPVHALGEKVANDSAWLFKVDTQQKADAPVSINTFLNELGILLPEGFPVIQIKEFSFEFNTKSKNFTCSGQSALKSYLNIFGASAELTLGIDKLTIDPNKKEIKDKITGTFLGAFELVGAKGNVTVSNNSDGFQLSGSLQNVDFSRLCKDVFNIDQPEGFPAIILKELAVGYNFATKDFNLNGEVEVEGELKIGEKTSIALHGAQLSISANKNGLQALEITLKGSANLIDDIKLPFVCLAFKYNKEENSWHLGGELAIDLFDRYMDFKASAASVGKNKNISFLIDFRAITSPEYFHEIKELKTDNLFEQLKEQEYLKKEDDIYLLQDKDISQLKLISPVTEEQAVKVTAILKKIQSGKELKIDNVLNFSLNTFEIKLELEDSKLSKLSVDGDANFTLYDIIEGNGKEIISNKKGKLELDVTNKEKSLTFSSEDAEFKPLAFIPGLPEELKNVFSVGLEKLTIKKEEKEWILSAQAFLEIKESELQKINPDLKLNAIFSNPKVDEKELEKTVTAPTKEQNRRISGTCSISSKEGIELKLVNNDFYSEPNLTSIFRKSLEEIKAAASNNEFKNAIQTILNSLPETGVAYFCLEKIGITLSKKFKFDIDLAIGLPERLNEILFGNLPVPLNSLNGIISTYKKSKKDDTVMKATLSIKDEGISGALTNFPPLNWEKVNEIIRHASEELAKILDNGVKLILEGGKEKKLTDDGIAKEKIIQVIIDFDGLLGITNDKEKRYGSIALEVPCFEFSFKTGAFKISGGYKILSDFLRIPIPLSLLLNKLDSPGQKTRLSDIADFIPDGIPVRSVDFIKDKKLSLNDLESYINDCTPKKFQPFTLPQTLKTTIEHLGGTVVNRLPERLQEYMGIHLPKGFYFSLEVTADQSIAFSIDVDSPKFKVTRENLKEAKLPQEITDCLESLVGKEYNNKYDLRDEMRKHVTAKQLFPHEERIVKALAGKNFHDALQIIIPMGLSPMLIGLRLRRLTFGSALFNTAFRVDFSGEIDMFNLLELCPALLLPDKKEGDLILPDREKLRQSIVIDKLVVFIFCQAGVPIPVPVFAREFDIQVENMLGQKHRFRWDLAIEMGITDILKDAKEIFNLLKDSSKFLTPKHYPYNGTTSKGDININVGPDYTMLPGLIGYEHDGSDKNKHQITIGFTDPVVLSLTDLLSLTANTLKGLILKKNVSFTIDEKNIEKKPVNYLVEYIKPEDRVNIKNIKLLHLFDVEMAWAISTPDEFTSVVYPMMLKKYTEAAVKKPKATSRPSPAKQFLDLLAQEDSIHVAQSQDQGLVIFLRGEIDIAGIINLEGAIGALVSEQKGFRTGIAIKGNILDWIETSALFFLKISPNSRLETFKILGDIYLKAFEHEIVKGYAEITNTHLKFAGMLNAFPDRFPIQLKGAVDGIIESGRFELNAFAGLQLGLLRAASTINVSINEREQLFTVDLTFPASEISFHVYHRLENGNEWFDTEFMALMFNLVKFEGDLRIKRENRNIQLNGSTRLEVLGVNILKLHLIYSGELNTDKGFLGLSAQLLPGSYILTPQCRPYGGAAFYTWFTGDHAGDFVLTIGGYHPSFNVPDHYPRVPRVGINWAIDQHTCITGEAYLAITPNAIMAGGRMELVYQNKNVRAWFIAYANFLCQWKPLYYEAQIGVQVGASYTADFLLFAVTASITIDATLELWGPPTGGRIEFSVLGSKIRIAIGEKRQAPPLLSSWNDFRKAFLPENILSITPVKGLMKAIEKERIWVIRPDEFCFTVTTAIPVNEANEYNTNNALNIKPLKKTSIHSKLVVTFDSKQIEKGNTIKGNVPSSLWGNPSLSDNNVLDHKYAMVKDVITGMEFPPLAPQEDDNPIVVQPKYMGYSDNPTRKLPSISKEVKTTIEQNSLNNLEEKLSETEKTRNNVFEELQKLGYCDESESRSLRNNGIKGLTQKMKEEWTDCPLLIS